MSNPLTPNSKPQKKCLRCQNQRYILVQINKQGSEISWEKRQCPWCQKSN